MMSVQVVNQSTSVGAHETVLLARALTIQALHMSSAGWGVNAVARVVDIAKGEKPNPAHPQLVLRDSSDVEGAGGYHETTSEGMPIAYVFVKTLHDAGMSWTVGASHEFCEMVVDPWAEWSVDGDGYFIALEVCDAVEADVYGYVIELPDNGTNRGGKVKVSDFVTRAWFSPGSKGPWDWGHHVTRARQILPGGYIGVWTNMHGWQNYAHRKRAKGEGNVTRVSMATRINRRKRGSRRSAVVFEEIDRGLGLGWNDLLPLKFDNEKEQDTNE